MTGRRLTGLFLLAIGLLANRGATQQSLTVPVIFETVGTPGTFRANFTPETLQVDIDGRAAVVEDVSQRAPLNVMLLVDVSISAALQGEAQPTLVGKVWRGYDPRETIRLLTREVVDRLLPQHRLRVARFGVSGSFVTSERFTNDPTEAARDVEALVGIDGPQQSRSFGPSPIWDAVAFSVDIVSNADGPGAIILVTDGISTGNWLSVHEAAALAAARQVPVHVVFRPRIFASGQMIDVRATGDLLLRQLATQTGGLFRGQYSTLPRAPHRLPPDGQRPAFVDIAAAMSASRVIRIRREASVPDARAISIRSTLPGVRVHAPQWLRAHAPAVSGEGLSTRLPEQVATESKDATADADGMTALHRAAATNQLTVVQQLIANGAIVDAARVDGHTPLMTAAFHGHLAVLDYLITHGADVNMKSRQGFTALSQAIRSGDLAVVRTLLARGASARVADTAGWTPADVAFATNRDDVLSVVLPAAFGSDPDPPSLADIEPAIRAALRENLSVSAYFDVRIDVKGIVRSHDRTDEHIVYAVVRLQDSGRDVDVLDLIRHAALRRTSGGWQASLVTW